MYLSSLAECFALIRSKTDWIGILDADAPTVLLYQLTRLRMILIMLSRASDDLVCVTIFLLLLQ